MEIKDYRLNKKYYDKKFEEELDALIRKWEKGGMDNGN